MLSRCTLAHYFTTAARSLESVHVSSLRPFHSSRPYLSVPTNTQQHMSASLYASAGFSANFFFSDLDSSSWEKLIPSDTSPSVNDVSHRTPRQPRQAMTARESNAFNEMFAMVFDAASAQEKSLSSSDSVIGVGTDGIDDLIGKLRKYPKRLKWSTELDDILDRQKEVINLFTTDQELLEWATDAVFGESKRYEAAARKAISEVASSGVKGDLPMLQPPTYPHLVAFIMQTFREKFNDPHLALSMFEHARNLSIASYVFGCSSQAYHQLIETRWKCFQDLTGVLEALQEMQLNGVRVSGQTRRLVEKLRREIGEKHLWAEESEVGSNEVLNILAQIERLALSSREAVPHGNGKANGSSQDVKWDEWKAFDTKDEGGDEWGFDQWSSRPRRVFGRERNFDEVKRLAGGSVPSRQSRIEDKPSVGASSSQPRDISWGDEWDFNEDELESRDATKFMRGKTSVTERTPSKRSDFMDDWSLDNGEFPSSVSSSKTGTYGNKDEWRFSQGTLQKRDVEEEGRRNRGKGPSRTARSRSPGPKDDWSFEDGESSVDWLNPSSQAGDDWSLDDGEFSSSVSSPKADTHGNKAEWRFSQDKLQKRDIEEEGRRDRRKGPSRTARLRSPGMKDDWSFEDGGSSVDWPNPSSQTGDDWSLDKDTFNEPKRRGRTLNRRRFGLRTDASQLPQK